MNFLTNINLNGNELQNVVIQNVATDPSNPKKGQLWFNTTESVFKYLKQEGEIKVIGNGTLTEADVAQLRESVVNLNSVVNSEENGLSAVANKANEAKTVAGQAKSTADNAAAAAAAAQTTANSKVEKVTGGVDNIVLFAADGALKDSGVKIADIGTGGSGEVDTSGLISKVSGAVEGNLPSLAADGSLVDSGYSVKGTLLSEGSTEIPTSNAVALYLDEKLSSVSQGIVFRGVINSQDEVKVPYNVGDMYYIGTAGTYFGYTCEIGDVLIAKATKTEGTVVETTDWSVLESNKDVFKGASAELVGSSGLVPAPEMGTLRYLDSTGAWTAPVATRWSGSNDALAASGGAATWNINHGLGRKDVQVVVYEVISDYEYNQVMCNVTLTGSNYCNVIINTNTDIEAGKYFAVVM